MAETGAMAEESNQPTPMDMEREAVAASVADAQPAREAITQAPAPEQEPEQQPEPGSASQDAAQPASSLPQQATAEPEPTAVPEPAEAKPASAKKEPAPAKPSTRPQRQKPQPPPPAPPPQPQQQKAGGSKLKASSGGSEARRKPGSEQLASVKAKLLFDKATTFSDTNGQGRILIPKSAAAEHFPPIDNQTGTTVNFVDTLGNAYTLKFRYWANGAGRIFILEGTQQLQARYGVQNGDTVSFGKKGDGTLVVCCSACKPERPVVPGPKGFKGKAAKAAASKEAKETDGAERKRKRPSNASAPTSKIAKPTKVQKELLQDGVFRAIPGLTSEQAAVVHLNGTWTATLDLAGELYRACFDSQETAVEAFHAAGAVAA